MNRIVVLVLTMMMLFSALSSVNAESLQSVYKIGIAQFTNSSNSTNAPQFIADTFANELPKTVNVKTRKIKDEIIFSNKDSIIRTGSQNGVDAILTGAITEYTIKEDIWFGGIYAKVRVEAALYDAKTGEILWKGFVTERYRGDTELHCLQKAARETVFSLKKSMVDAGMQGRPADNEKPTIDTIDNQFSWTSVYFLEGFVKDNFDVSRLMVNGQASTFNNDGKFTTMISIKNPPVNVELKAEDEAGNITTKNVQILKTGSLQGNIAQIIGNKIFINKGSMDGVRESMGFTILSTQQIKDPATGQVLDTVTTEVGIIKVVEVKDKLSIAELVTVLNGGKVNIGDSVY